MRGPKPLRHRAIGLMLAGVMVVTSGCASIFAGGGSPLEVHVDAPPAGTTIAIDNVSGYDDRVHKNLNALRTDLRGGGTYTVTVSRPGSKSEVVSLSRSLNPLVYANVFPIILGTGLLVLGLTQPTSRSGSTLGAAAGDAITHIAIVFLSFLAGMAGVSGTVGGLIADFSSGNAWSHTPNVLRIDLEEEN